VLGTKIKISLTYHPKLMNNIKELFNV